MIDRKYKILAVNPCTKTIHTEDDSLLFSARDKFLPTVLAHYYEACKNGGAGDSHLESISLLRDRVIQYQIDHGHKIPDTHTPCEIDRCIGGKV